MRSPHSNKANNVVEAEEKKSYRNRFVSFPHYDSPSSKHKKSNHNSFSTNNNVLATDSPGSAIIGRKTFSAIPSNADVLDAMSVAVARANRTRTESGAGLLGSGGLSHSNSNDLNDVTNNTSNSNNIPALIVSPKSQKKTSFISTKGEDLDADDENEARNLSQSKRIMYDSSNSNKSRNNLLSIVSDTASPSLSSNRKHLSTPSTKQRITVWRQDCDHSSDEDEKQLLVRINSNNNNNHTFNDDAHSLSTVSLHSIEASNNRN